MNKLTEEQISDIWNKADNSRREESYLAQDVFDLILHVQHLSALLEEKDKALAMLADKKNWTRRWTENSAELVWIWTEDGSPHEVAQAAYTSSNNEGEI